MDGDIRSYPCNVSYSSHPAACRQVGARYCMDKLYYYLQKMDVAIENRMMSISALEYFKEYKDDDGEYDKYDKMDASNNNDLAEEYQENR